MKITIAIVILAIAAALYVLIPGLSWANNEVPRHTQGQTNLHRTVTEMPANAQIATLPAHGQLLQIHSMLLTVER